MTAHMIPDFRTGTGFDVHRLTAGRDLWLCGIKIPHTLGLLGHSAVSYTHLTLPTT